MPLPDVRALITAIRTLDEDFYVYKGARFWSEAAVKYLQEIVKERRENWIVSKMAEHKQVLLVGGLTVTTLAVAMTMRKN